MRRVGAVALVPLLIAAAMGADAPKAQLQWQQRTTAAAWAPRTGLRAAAFLGEVWITGGQLNDSFYGDAWHSADGSQWHEAPTPLWQSRAFHGMVVFEAKLFVLGGCTFTQANSMQLLGDTWSTPDGSASDRAARPTPRPARP